MRAEIQRVHHSLQTRECEHTLKAAQETETRQEHKQACTAYRAAAARLVKRTLLCDLSALHVHRTVIPRHK
ncbi:hypothetical protein Q7C36_019319 [Tachysurus vachellii]|uniref:Uncharacterized protein n=1 Tax=Tachysurus vachellii TaxID=175792 RepID=A0AA88S819_TACVA|nr:hypothetical protein Q7C36_019319 [Tachysurus vachellii]